MRGLMSTELVWNMETLSWNFVNLRSKKVIAYTNDTDDYPLGTHKWIFTDGRCQDNNIVNYRSMNLHSCGDNQFTCKDGQCIDWSLRCDLGYHCQDFSDEENCTIFTVPNYDKETPPPIMAKGNQLPQLTTVFVSLDIMDILEVNEVDSKVTISFMLSVTWNDARIYFKSLQNNEENNIIPNYDDIWRPNIKVINSLPGHEFTEDDITVLLKNMGRDY